MAEHRFRSLDGNEWVTLTDPTPEVMADYPEGTVEIPMVPIEPASLVEVKAGLKTAIDAVAEAQRTRHITPGYGQAMTYMQKAEEARHYLTATDPVFGDYPLMLAEVGITAPTLGEVAAVVHAAYTQWQQIGAAIEAVRLGTKAAIDVATTIEAAEAVAEAASWPL